MAYSTLAEVQAEFKKIDFTMTSLVSDADVSSYIEQGDALIYSYVGKRYSLPIDPASEGFKLLKMISLGLAAERVRAVLEVKQVTNKDGAQNPRRPLDVQNLMKILKDISEGNVQLVGVDLAVNGSGIYSENNYNSVVPEFNKSSTQW